MDCGGIAAVADPGERTTPPPPFFYQNEARKAKKNFLGDRRSGSATVQTDGKNTG